MDDNVNVVESYTLPHYIYHMSLRSWYHEPEDWKQQQIQVRLIIKYLDSEYKSILNRAVYNFFLIRMGFSHEVQLRFQDDHKYGIEFLYHIRRVFSSLYSFPHSIYSNFKSNKLKLNVYVIRHTFDYYMYEVVY